MGVSYILNDETVTDSSKTIIVALQNIKSFYFLSVFNAAIFASETTKSIYGNDKQKNAYGSSPNTPDITNIPFCYWEEIIRGNRVLLMTVHGFPSSV